MNPDEISWLNLESSNAYSLICPDLSLIVKLNPQKLMEASTNFFIYSNKDR